MTITDIDKQMYTQDGFIIKKAFFTKDEIELLVDLSTKDDVLKKHTYGRKDKDGNPTNLALWYSLGNDVYSAFTRSRRMVKAVENLLDGIPCHFHTKIMQKAPKVGGAWEWHQDYGYWYHDGFLYPFMMSVMIALTQANQENGCLQVLKGSHLLGRIDHGKTGDQKGADMLKVNEALNRLDLVYVELEPGDALFFHGNLLHRSDRNSSENSRWSMISTFNRIDNKPYKKNDPSCYTPIEVIQDEDILKFSSLGVSDSSNFNDK